MPTPWSFTLRSETLLENNMAAEIVGAEEVGGIIDNILAGLIGNLKPDWKKIDKAKFKSGISLTLDSLKTMIDGSVDDMLIDAAKTVIFGLIDGLPIPGPGPITVGAKRHRSKEEVEKLIREHGGDPTKFAPFLLILLQFLPDAIALILKILGK